MLTHPVCAAPALPAVRFKPHCPSKVVDIRPTELP